MNRVPAGIKRGRFTETEEDHVAELSERGLTPGQIARRLNRHPSSVNFVMHRLGLHAPKPRAFEYVRGGVTVRSFSGEEDAFLTVLRRQGFGLAKIVSAHGNRFGFTRTNATIRVRLMMLANRDELAGRDDGERRAA